MFFNLLPRLQRAFPSTSLDKKHESLFRNHLKHYTIKCGGSQFFFEQTGAIKKEKGGKFRIKRPSNILYVSFAQNEGGIDEHPHLPGE